jgi:hypothetical protein
MKPTSPGPNDSFILRIDGKPKPCEDCGALLYRKLPPRDGMERYACKGCGAAYLLPNPGPPKLLEN